MANINDIKAEVNQSTVTTESARAAFAAAMSYFQEGQDILRSTLEGSTHIAGTNAENILQQTLSERDVVVGLIQGIIASNTAYIADL